VRLPEAALKSPLKHSAGQIDFCVVRENNEGEYSDVGGRIFRDSDEEMAMQQTSHAPRSGSNSAICIRAGKEAQNRT